jgi:hypothetical protein
VEEHATANKPLTWSEGQEPRRWWVIKRRFERYRAILLHPPIPKRIAVWQQAPFRAKGDIAGQTKELRPIEQIVVRRSAAFPDDDYLAFSYG